MTSIASGFSSLGNLAPSNRQSLTAAKTPKDELLEYLQKSPVEKMREMILRSIGETEESIKAMTAEQRAEIEEKIAELIKQKVEKHTEKETGIPPKGSFLSLNV
jgi:DNA-binding transcriptional MerR regulator